MSRANVPKFGNWENEDNVPYTVYFEKARKNKVGEKMINPNDPEENPDMYPNADPAPVPSKPRTQPGELNGRGAGGAAPERGVSKEEGEFSNSPARGDSNYGGGRGQRPGRPSRTSGGSEQSFDRSPLHPHHQAKVMGRGSGSPSWEGRSQDNSHGTPGRSRLKPTTRGDESPDKGAAVPRFGEWDETNPQSAENFTHIFNKVREEKNMGVGNMSSTPKHPSYGMHGQGGANQPKKWWSSCVCW